MTTHSDEFIEHWAEVFRQGRIKALLDIDFGTFLEDPKAWCAAAACVSRAQAGEFEPLLPAQQAAVDRVNAEATTAALMRLDAGTQTEADMPVIRDALERSATGRRILAVHLAERSHHRVSA